MNRPNLNSNNRPNWASNDRPNNSRPTIANRPDFNRPDGNRPDWAGNRPGANGGGEQWNRPDGNGNRPDWNVNNRPHIGDNNFNNINVNHNWNNNINRWANNRPNNGWNRPWYNHYDHWHNGWHHGYWNYWGNGSYPWAWFGAGAALGWWASPGVSYVYENPYYVAPVDSTVYYPDYSDPIPPPQDQAAQTGEPVPEALADEGAAGGSEDDPNTQKAVAIFDAGRELFKSGDYKGALDKVNQAIQLLPSDATLHEFRALCLFALKQYKEAAAGVYAVLSAGPGWDWDSLRALYPDTSVYTTQLRALEEYQKAHPDATDASFLLAYHYLVMGYPDQAVKQLDRVVKAQPNDKLASAILQALEKRGESTPQPQPTVGSNRAGSPSKLARPELSLSFG